MARYLVVRSLQALGAVVVVILVTFGLLQITPGDPAFAILGPRSTEAERAALRDELGLDEHFVVQFGRYAANVVTGDLGRSNKTHVPVTEIISTRIGPTVELLVGGLLLTLLVAIPLSVLAASHRDGLLDHTIRVVSLVGLFLPTFWIGFMLLAGIALRTGWFPVSGLSPGVWGNIRSLVLPSTALAIGLAPVFVRSLRSSMITVLESESVAAARSLGLTPWRVVRRHVLRNAAAPTLSLLATTVGFLLFGVVVLETTFDIDGLGSALVLAAGQRDIPVIQGITLVFATAVVGVSLVADLLAAAIDPRVRLR